MPPTTPRAPQLIAVWLTLIALLSATAALAQAHLSGWNLAISLAIAAMKIALIVWVYMELRQAARSIRLAGALALALLVVLAGLGAVDVTTRTRDPAAWQSPQQIGPQLLQHHRSAGTDGGPSRRSAP